jgi:hypothetical protein
MKRVVGTRLGLGALLTRRVVIDLRIFGESGYARGQLGRIYPLSSTVWQGALQLDRGERHNRSFSPSHHIWMPTTSWERKRHV